MASKSFTPGTVIDSAWLNDVNGITYGLKTQATGTPIITTALGFTPYSSANPSGYQTAANVTSAITSYGYQTSANVSTAITSALTPYATTAALSSYLPLAGGTLGGNLTFANNTGLFFKDTGGVVHQTFIYSGDNNIYLNMPVGGYLNYMSVAGVMIARLDNGGTFSATTITQTSDEAVKENWSPVQPNFLPQLASIKKVGMFDWIDSKETSLGIGAQSLEAVLPAAVHTDNYGHKTVNYGGAAMVAVVELTKLVLELQDKIKQLEEGK